MLLPVLLQLLLILILPGGWWQDGRTVRKDQLSNHQVPRGHQTNSCSINLAHFVRWRHDPWSVVTQFRIKENNCWGQTILPGGNRCRFLHLEYMPMRRAAQTQRLSQNFKGEKYCHSQWRRSLACTWLFTEQSSIKLILRCQYMFAIQNFCQVHLFRNEWLYSMVQGRLGENK